MMHSVNNMAVKKDWSTGKQQMWQELEEKLPSLL